MKTSGGGPAAVAIGVLLVVGAAAAGQLCYVRADRSALGYDQAEYLARSVDLFHAAGRGVIPFFSAYASRDIKAPLLALLPAPFYLAFGLSPETALYANTAMLLVLNLYVYLLAARLSGPRAALFSLFLLNTTPSIYGLSRTFMVELGLTTLTAAFLFHLVASDGLRSRAHAGALGLVLGLGLLMKTLFPLYVLVPFLLAVRDRRRYAAAAAVLATGAALAGTWYWFNWMRAVGFALSAGFGQTAADFGSAAVFDPRVLFAYLRVLAGQLSGPYALALAAAVALFPRSFQPWWILPPFLVLAFGVNKDPRYAAPLIPALVIGLGAALDRTAKRGALASALAAGLLLLGAGRYLADFLRRPTHARESVSLEMGKLLPPLERAAALRGGPLSVVVVSSLAHFDSATLSYYGALRRFDGRFHSLGTRPPHPAGDGWTGDAIPLSYASLGSLSWLLTGRRPAPGPESLANDLRQLKARGATHLLVSSAGGSRSIRAHEDAVFLEALRSGRIAARRLETMPVLTASFSLYELAPR